MEQFYVISPIKDIPKKTLSSEIAGLIAQTIKDYGKAVDEEQRKHIIARVYVVLTTKYRNWEWREVITAFERGKVGHFGGESRCSVTMILRWLAGHQTDRNKQAANDSVQEKQDLSNTTKTMMDGNYYGAAIQWKSRLNREQQSRLNALRDKKIDVIDAIVQHMKNGTDPLMLIA